MTRCCANRLIEVDTILTADSVEWCSCTGLEYVLACGTYQLDDKSGKRFGSLTLYDWNRSQLNKILAFDTRLNGILDMKWYPDGDLLALANSNGTVQFLCLNHSEHLSFNAVGEADVLSKTDDLVREDTKVGLCLSLDWSKQKCSAEIAVSDSFGCVSIVSLLETGPKVQHHWKAHDFEAWIVTFGFPASQCVFSGGDDCKLHMWDTRVGFKMPCFTSKRHEMGVCSLQMNPTDDHILASGSYDEHLLLWDTRNMSQPFKESSLGGGIWRIKWNPGRTNYAATACMHNGFCVVDCHLKTAEPIELLCNYKEHASLAYGIDWHKVEKEKSVQDTLASCSFYDHSMHIWSIA